MTASLNDMFEAANDAILTHDVNYRVTRANAITESLYGYSSPACERKTYMISVHWTYRRPLMSRCGIRPRTMGRDGKPSMCGRMERFFLWTSLPNRSLEVSSFTLYASSATSENANIREEALRAIDVRFPHYNPAAVEFVEHVPVLGSDHWCVRWKVYRHDRPLFPHDECPHGHCDQRESHTAWNRGQC